jgi:hypothetical protein
MRRKGREGKRERKGKDLEEEGVDRVVGLEDLVDCDTKSESPQDLSLRYVQHLCHILPFQLLLHVSVGQQQLLPLCSSSVFYPRSYDRK